MTGPDRDESPLARKTGVALAWLPIVGCVVAGLVGLMGAVLGLEKTDGRFTGGGVYLIGSAVAFGLLTSAMLRK
jgi:hypothetical protein